MAAYDPLQAKVTEAFRSSDFLSEPGELYEPIAYALSQGGKRIRPLLVLLGCDLFGGDPEEALKPAIGVEIFHNFTLLHDDIMDQAPLRRGSETVYKRWSTNTAILSGDTMFAMAYEYIAHVKSRILPEVLALFSQTAREVCEGQQYDMNFESAPFVPIPEYMRMIRLKTAVLIACSLKLGAIIAGAGREEKEMIYDFGISLGLAFQLQDDLLDAFADGDKFGKEIGGDISANKKTFLLLKAMELADEPQKKELLALYSSTSTDKALKIRKVTDIFRDSGIEKITREEIRRWYSKAMQCLDSIRIPDEKKQGLREFSAVLLNREY